MPAVLGEVEVDAADEMPRRALTLEKLLDRRLRFGELGSKRISDRSPECFEDRRGDVLGAGHWRRGRCEDLELAERGRGYWRVRIETGMRADGRDQPRGEVAPVTGVCWKRGPDFASAELEQSVTRATSEGPFERPPESGRRLGGVVRAIE